MPQRHPDLRIGFLEGGAGWACDILHGLHEHYEKRSAAGIRNYDPARIDLEALTQLCEQYGRIGDDQVEPNPTGGATDRTAQSDNGALDEFALSMLKDEHDLVDMFGRRFFFGCEADDTSVFRALDAKGNDFGLRLNPFFSSDIGHWDVPEISEVLLESHQLVDQGLLSDADYRDFVFANPVRLHAGMNPRFFDGTPVESAAQEVLKAPAR